MSAVLAVFALLLCFALTILYGTWRGQVRARRNVARCVAAPAVVDETLVTWQQVADLLPVDVVDSIVRAQEGREPVLNPEVVRVSVRRLETGDIDPATGFRVIRHPE